MNATAQAYTLPLWCETPQDLWRFRLTRLPIGFALTEGHVTIARTSENSYTVVRGEAAEAFSLWSVECKTVNGVIEAAAAFAAGVEA